MKNSNKTGSLPVALLFALALLGVVLSVLSLSQTSFKLTMRNEYRAQARAVAESELEHLFYLFKEQIDTGRKAPEVPSALATLGVLDLASEPATPRDAYLTLHRNDGWVVRRSMTLGSSFSGIDSNGDRGDITYADVRVEVEAPPNSPWFNAKQRGIAPIRFGRQFSAAVSTVFQHSVFYQGDLEIAPGNATEFDSILVNGSVYIGAGAGGSVLLKSTIKYPKSCGFNTNSGPDGVFGSPDDINVYSTYRKPNTPVGSTLTAPDFEFSRDQQLMPMDEQSNFLGGANALAVQQANPSLFPTINDVYRSVIVPPPSAGNTNEYAAPGSLTESVAIANTRLYNRADIVVTVEANGTVSIQSRPRGSQVDVSTTMASIISAKTSMYDYREKKMVSVTEIDVGILKDLIAAGVADPSQGKVADFKGVVYVNLKRGDKNAPSAVRLVNAGTLPASGDGTGGFSLVTNGGLYVKGDYNTTTLADGKHPRSMLMADAMTVLSKDWSDAVANADRGVASPDISKRIPTESRLEVHSALMLGNSPATATNLSGGVQNLVRYLEDWSGKTVEFHGSIGRLFDSKMFTRPFEQPGTVYIQPKYRYFKFDQELRVNGGPPGSIANTRTSRGRFFVW